MSASYFVVQKEACEAFSDDGNFWIRLDPGCIGCGDEPVCMWKDPSDCSHNRHTQATCNATLKDGERIKFSPLAATDEMNDLR